MPVIEHVNIAGIACCVPSEELDNAGNTAFPADDIAQVIENTGIRTRRSAKNICTSDLCYRAAVKLLNELQYTPESIDALIFVSQTPDYVLPATACTLQHRLNLPKRVMAFDINLGCSGYTYGLIVAAQLLGTGNFKRILLLTGDTISKLASEQDKTVALLFGDAGAATLLEYSPNAAPMFFDCGTDGSGADGLMVEAGGFRVRHSAGTSERQRDDAGNCRAKSELYMSGPDVFAFTIREVPKTIRKTLDEAHWSVDDVQAYFFHQANAFMLKHLIKKMGIPPEKAPITMDGFGNTSAASIPLAMCLAAGDVLSTLPANLVLSGFGVGFSWATVACQLNNTNMVALEYYGNESSI
ncbi:ketoacyl-ACP synthase III [Legionella geestiana]|uniref:3-oxoacyl-ACP synthase III family protein n=1 Tax=Legionella geestiana TaxID=45065 RepID=UPI001091EA0D|nr:ketoacyl-ACP synthase III [Legionella geestiana]QDQ39997.1 ketoacyl-ACP synthase III [Legionella geestiana]